MVWSREQCGEFLDAIEAERLYALYHLAAYYGLRRSELCGLAWAEVDLPGRRIHVRQAQVDDVLDSTKSADSEPTIVIDQDTAAELLAWRKTQLAERMAWGSAWTDSGRVFTREDGTRCGRGGPSPGSIRSPPARACPPSPCTGFATARPRCCSRPASRRRSSARSWGTVRSLSRWTSTPR